jgi:hypothetical protein
MRELTLNDLPDLLDEDYVATRSFNDLLAEGIPHKGRDQRTLKDWRPCRDPTLSKSSPDAASTSVPGSGTAAAEISATVAYTVNR